MCEERCNVTCDVMCDVMCDASGTMFQSVWHVKGGVFDCSEGQCGVERKVTVRAPYAAVNQRHVPNSCHTEGFEKKGTSRIRVIP